MSQYEGNKSLKLTGQRRLVQFAEQTFKTLEAERKATIVVGGHSLWFKNFFRYFLPAEERGFGGDAVCQLVFLVTSDCEAGIRSEAFGAVFSKMEILR
jgi:hypothetical protein